MCCLVFPPVYFSKTICSEHRFFRSQEHRSCDFERAGRFILIKKEDVAMVDLRELVLRSIGKYVLRKPDMLGC